MAKKDGKITVKKWPQKPVEEQKEPGINDYPIPANSFTSLYKGWVVFISKTFRHLGDAIECMITADIQENRLFVVLIAKLSPTCSVEVSKTLITANGWFTCTATRVRLMRALWTKEEATDGDAVLVPTVDMENTQYYREFFKDYL